MTEVLDMFDEDDSAPLPSAKANIIAASVKVAKVKSEWLLTNDIVRFQLLEYLLRCAIKKYFESQITETEADAVKMFIANHVDKYIGDKYDQNLWRIKNTFNV